MPQTTSAVALWVVKLDALIAPYFVQADSDRALAKGSTQTSMLLVDSLDYLMIYVHLKAAILSCL